MVTDDPRPLVHLFVPAGLTFTDRILCHVPDQHLNPHVTEYGNQVTCGICLALMKAGEPDD